MVTLSSEHENGRTLHRKMHLMLHTHGRRRSEQIMSDGSLSVWRRSIDSSGVKEESCDSGV